MKNNGGLVFAAAAGGDELWGQDGITRRDWLAGQNFAALLGLREIVETLRQYGVGSVNMQALLARYAEIAYAGADACIAEGEKKEEEHK